MNTRKWFENTRFTWALVSFITISVIIGNSFLARKTITSLSETQSSLLNAAEVLNAIKDLHILVLSAETGQRGYLLTQDEKYLAPYNDALSELQLQMVTVSDIYSEIPGQKERIAQLIELIQMKMDELVKTVALALSDKEPTAIKMVLTGRGRSMYSEIRQQFELIENAENNLRTNLFKRLAATEKEAKVTFTISAITSALLLIGMVYLARINLRTEQRYRVELEEQNELLQSKVEERTDELNLYSQELRRSNRELEDFAFVASHDLQEPLRKIRAFGDRLQTSFADNLDEKGVDYINRMRNAAERMSDLINDLLNFSRITTRGKDFAEVDLNQTLATILDDLEIATSESEATIETCELPVVMADASQMYQLILNLLSNSIKFKQQGRAPFIRISYETREDEDEKVWHVITVSDNGIGFEQEYADKIFAPFQRLHARTEYEGTGIGLAVSRRIVERHQGHISATSEPGKGSVFTIELPADLIQINLDREQTDAV